MKRLAILCALVLSVALLSGCMPAIVITSPKDEEFQRDLADSIDEAAEDWAEDFESAWDEWAAFWDSRDENGKDHYWKVLDAEGNEVGTITEEEQTRLVDDLLSDDGHQETRMAEDPGDPAYSYVYCQQETLKTGQKPEDREYEDLVRFTVSKSKDVVTLVILEDMPTLLNVDLGDILTFTVTIPAETAETLRNPGQFLE